MKPSAKSTASNFFARYPLKHYKKGEVLVFANEQHRHIIYLVEGIVGQYDISDSGSKLFVNIYKPHAFFPMSWAINRTPNAYFFEALTDITTRLADPDETVSFIRQNPDVMYDLLGRVYRGTDALLKRLALAGGGSASSRLILELIMSAYRFGENVNERVYVLPVKRSDLAARTGLARETVSRLLAELNRSDIIELRRQDIYIPDISALERKL